MKTNVIAKIEIEGLHNWPAADQVFPEVGFLSHMHRHKWYITAKKPVHHDDRDVEFILFKRERPYFEIIIFDLCKAINVIK